MTGRRTRMFDSLQPSTVDLVCFRRWLSLLESAFQQSKGGLVHQTTSAHRQAWSSGRMWPPRRRQHSLPMRTKDTQPQSGAKRSSWRSPVNLKTGFYGASPVSSRRYYPRQPVSDPASHCLHLRAHALAFEPPLSRVFTAPQSRRPAVLTSP